VTIIAEMVTTEDLEKSLSFEKTCADYPSIASKTAGGGVKIG